MSKKYEAKIYLRGSQMKEIEVWNQAQETQPNRWRKDSHSVTRNKSRTKSHII